MFIVFPDSISRNQIHIYLYKRAWIVFILVLVYFCSHFLFSFIFEWYLNQIFVSPAVNSVYNTTVHIKYMRVNIYLMLRWIFGIDQFQKIESEIERVKARERKRQKNHCIAYCVLIWFIWSKLDFQINIIQFNSN